VLIELIVQVGTDGGALRIYTCRARGHFYDLRDASGFQRQFERRSFADVDLDARHGKGLEAGLLHFHLIGAGDQVRGLECSFDVCGDRTVTGLTADSDFGVRDGGAVDIRYAPADLAFGQGVLRIARR